MATKDIYIDTTLILVGRPTSVSPTPLSERSRGKSIVRFNIEIGDNSRDLFRKLVPLYEDIVPVSIEIGTEDYANHCSLREVTIDLDNDAFNLAIFTPRSADELVTMFANSESESRVKISERL